MQQCLHEQAGGHAGPPASQTAAMDAALRHRALLLIGAHRDRRMGTHLTHRVLNRLLQPAAQVEGVDLHLADPRLADSAVDADSFILLLPPLGNLSNAFYAVHPRRNDRFVAARDPLRSLFPEVDFAPFAFTGHVLGTLAATCPERFSEVRRGLAAAWVTRMRLLLDRLPPRGVLVDLPTPAWLPRPPIPGEGRMRLAIDPDDRTTGAEALRNAIMGRHR